MLIPTGSTASFACLIFRFSILRKVKLHSINATRVQYFCKQYLKLQALVHCLWPVLSQFTVTNLE